MLMNQPNILVLKMQRFYFDNMNNSVSLCELFMLKQQNQQLNTKTLQIRQ